MSYLVDHSRAVADPFRMGLGAACVGLMMPIARGHMFPWRDGGVALMRRALYPSTGEWLYCGLAFGEATQITNFPGMTHAASQAYEYVAVLILGNGFISPMSEPVRMEFDAQGDLITAGLPSAPIEVTVQAGIGGTYELVWEYDPFGQGAYPTDFQVFEGATAETVDYETPLTDSVTGLAYVSYVADQKVYAFTTGAFDNGSEHVFGVRGRNAGQVAELNTYATQSVVARDAAPVAAAAPMRVRVMPYSRVGG